MTTKAMYRLTADAKRDLTNIRHYTLQKWGKQQSTKYLADIRDTIRTLSEMPSMGKRRLDIDEVIFSFPHVSHTIYYTIANKQVVVVAVLHNSMVPSNHLEGRDH